MIRKYLGLIDEICRLLNQTTIQAKTFFYLKIYLRICREKRRLVIGKTSEF